ncbi:TonB-dependent receptor plug domain-containing protein [Zhongshania aliphaticivorans]|uniref:TonB-dependent receptor plug domain-containing protein n=1 Tax=Zhongshania aliphaticivorans TaxID=1470434 RepID=UPI0012E46C43|nr:TonB-dependent receptor [Zhongshania aliphaticivorans]CAA0110727.1 Vitamin B12 transporter BtuB [Zhongshania aliphaticivorans]
MHQHFLVRGFILSAASLILTSQLQANIWNTDDLPVVLTPAKLKQNRSEVPASVSVIDRDMITASGLKEIPELFRLIPGTSVGARDGWNYVVSYHGTNYRDSRRMQVLIDGRSVYQSGLATVDWNDIPITIQDIERIEVVRGPSSASYGANAFLGVINIITRHPTDINKYEANVLSGTENTENYRVSYADEFLNGTYRITLASIHDDGFDIDKHGNERLDSKTSQLFNSRYETHTNHYTISLGLGYKTGEVTDDYSDIDVTPPNTKTDDYYLSSKIEKEISDTHQLALRYNFSSQKQIRRWTVEIPPYLTGLNNNPSPLVLVDANEDLRATRQDIDIQDTSIWNKSLRSVAGVHLKKSRASSETYYGTTLTSNNYQIYFNIEKKIAEKFTINTGGSYEYEQDIGKNFSPRISTHYHINKNHSLRAIYSEAIRTPDLLETSANWTYTGRNVRPAADGQTTGVLIQSAEGNPNVKPEKIESREIGYYGNFSQYHLQWDVKIFYDQLDKLISNSLSLEKFNPVNNGNLKLSGIETEVDYRPNHKWLIHGSYAYIKSKAYSNSTMPFTKSTEESFTPKNSASALISYRTNENIQISLAQYYARAIGTSQNKFSRSDIRISKAIKFQNNEIEFSYSGQYRHDDDSELLSDNIYRNKLRQFIGVNFKY